MGERTGDRVHGKPNPRERGDGRKRGDGRWLGWQGQDGLCRRRTRRNPLSNLTLEHLPVAVSVLPLQLPTGLRGVYGGWLISCRSAVTVTRIELPRHEPLQIQVRWMIRRDMAEVLEIEQGSFEFPWAEEDFTYCLRQRNCIGMVAEMAESVVAFMIYELHRSRLHVLNFAVRRSHRRLGIGRQMVDRLVGKLSPERRDRILLEVRERNLPAQLFFRDAGFMAISVLKNFYQDSTEDAYQMQLLATASSETQPLRKAA